MKNLEQQFKDSLNLDVEIKEKEITVNGVTYHFKNIEGMQKAMHETIEFKPLNKLAYFVKLHQEHHIEHQNSIS